MNETAPGTISVTIDGDQYEQLARVAEAMNRATWTAPDNTALSVFENFVFPWMGDEFEEPEEMCAGVLEAIATSDDGLTSAPAPLHQERIAALRAAFVEAGLMRGGLKQRPTPET